MKSCAMKNIPARKWLSFSAFRFAFDWVAAGASAVLSLSAIQVFLWLLSFSVGMAAGLAQAAAPVPVPVPVQADGQTGLEQKLKLISAEGGITEVVYLLEAQNMLVATDTTSLYPPEAQKTPKIGYLRMLSAEGLVSLKPDAVITTTEAGPPVVLDQLRSAGVNLTVVDADHSWQEVKSKVAAVGRVTGKVKQAAALQKKLDAQWERAVAQVKACLPEKISDRPKLLFVLGHGRTPSVAGQGTAADALIQMVGGVNAMQGFTGYRALNDEALLTAAPDIVLTTTQGLQTIGGEEHFWSSSSMRMIPAYANRDLIHMDALQMMGFGPRLPQTVLTLHEAIRAAMQQREGVAGGKFAPECGESTGEQQKTGREQTQSAS